MPNSSIRPPAVAGSFYPGSAGELRAELDRCLGTAVSPAPTFTAAATSNQRSSLKALIVPHAGYIYSGTTAGRAYAELAPLAGRIRRVVLIGPTHRIAVRGIALPSVDGFATPLGTVALDRPAMAALGALPQIVTSDAAHAQEHALEVQLPFLQAVLGEFALVPLAVGDATAAEVAQVLALLWGGEETLIVASSDLSHYRSYGDAQQIDQDTAARILGLELLTSYEQACGALPINGLLHVASQRGMNIARLAQCNSGDTAGDKMRVVGYASFALYEAAHSAESDADRLGRALLGRARDAIASQFGKRAPVMGDHPALAEPGATFITLKLDGELRGCVGSVEARRSLAEDVQANALGAAFRDPRFAPLSPAEVDRIQIEVSLLSAPVPLHFSSEADALGQLRPGVDGVLLVVGERRATFLPQVWEQLPEPRQFLAQLKLKAGLPPDWWADDAQLARYEVRKWKE